MSMYGTKVTKECEQKRVRAVTMGAPEVQASYELFRSMPLFEGVEYEAVLQLAVQAKKIEVEGESRNYIFLELQAPPSLHVASVYHSCLT